MIKFLIDRKIPSRLTIKNRQDFETILRKVPKHKSLNNPWFYGAIGFSSLILFLIFLSVS